MAGIFSRQVELDLGSLGVDVLSVGASLSTRHTWTALQHDGPNHLGLWFSIRRSGTRLGGCLGRPVQARRASSVSGFCSGAVFGALLLWLWLLFLLLFLFLWLLSLLC